MRTSNPTLTNSTFTGAARGSSTQVMTVQGTVNKTALLVAILFIAAVFTWKKALVDPASANGWCIGGAIVGLIIAIVTRFKMEWAPVTAPLYAVAEGLFLGAISAMFNTVYNGIVLQAVMLTGGTLLALLAVYSMRIIKVTENFRLGIFAATGGIMLVYLISIVLNLFGISIPYIHGSGIVGIGFSIVVVIIAALNLVLDFDFIENGSAAGAPKYMEWYAGFGLLVTLVWLYLEILKLLAKLADRR